MKKLTRKKTEYLQNTIKKEFRKSIWLAKKIKRLKLNRKRIKHQKFSKMKNITIAAPETFNLNNAVARNELLIFLHNILHRLICGDKVKISFDMTKLLTPGGTLFFIATIENLLKKYPNQITCNYPNDETVEQLFQHIGALAMLGLSSRRAISAENVRHWRYLNGTTTYTEGFITLFKYYADEIKNDISSLYDSMVEAITNTIQHAYESSNVLKKDERKWWMFSQQVNGKITVVICDLGMGIPNSISNKPELRDYVLKLKNIHRKRINTSLIEIAVRSTRSRTKLSHRGKGLPDMLNVVRNGNVGSFLIHSYKGAFSFNAESKQESSGRDFDTSIPGTLIQWEIPLPQKCEKAINE